MQAENDPRQKTQLVCVRYVPRLCLLPEIVLCLATCLTTAQYISSRELGGIESAHSSSVCESSTKLTLYTL